MGGIGPSAEEQEDAYAEQQRQLAEARVERREKMGQAPQPEKVLGDDVEDDEPEAS